MAGRSDQILVTAWNSDTGEVKVDWPPQIPPVIPPNRFSHSGRTKLDKARYEPLDPEAFAAATTG